MISVCAWCHPEIKTDPNVTHTICKDHAAILLREAGIPTGTIAEIVENDPCVKA